jgi:callose synthase
MGNCGSSFKDEDERNQRFMNLNMNMIKEDYWREKVCNYTAF